MITILCFAGDGIIPLTVPTQTPDTCYLQTLTDCVNGTTNCTLQTTSRLRLVGSVRDVVVQTSSKFYKPGETSKYTPKHVVYLFIRSLFIAGGPKAEFRFSKSLHSQFTRVTLK